jgi:hypothetical protein
VGPCDLPLKSVQTISNFEFSEFPTNLKYPHHIDEFDPLLCSSDFCKGRGNSQNPAHFIWKSFLLGQLDFFEPIKAWILQKKLKTRSFHEILIYWLCTRKVCIKHLYLQAPEISSCCLRRLWESCLGTQLGVAAALSRFDEIGSWMSCDWWWGRCIICVYIIIYIYDVMCIYIYWLTD